MRVTHCMTVTGGATDPAPTITHAPHDDTSCNAIHWCHPYLEETVTLGASDRGWHCWTCGRSAPPGPVAHHWEPL